MDHRVNLPHRFERTASLGAPAQAVFDRLDNFELLGAHMTRSSWMMAGSSMRYEFDEARGRKLNAHVRLCGSILGMALEIEEQVIEYTRPLRKTWETIGSPRMLVLAAYRMGFALMPGDDACRLQVFIDYALPETRAGRWLGRIAGAPYARWCVSSMVADAVRHFGNADDRLSTFRTRNRSAST